MITPKVLLCADSVVRDAQSNRISVFNIFEKFSPKGFPALVARFSILVILQREVNDPDRIDGRLRITLAQQTLYDGVVPVQFEGQVLSRGIITFEGFVLPGAGDLVVSLEVAGIQVQTYSMKVDAPAAHPVANIAAG